MSDSDESSDSLPSPGFVSVFRHRHPSSTEQGGEADGGAESVGGGGDTVGGGGEAVRGGGETVGDGGESVGGGDTVGGGEEAGCGGETVGVGGEAVHGGGEAVGGGAEAVGGGEYGPLPGHPSTAWTLEALLRSKTAPEQVIEFRSGVGGGILWLSLIILTIKF